MTLRLLTVEDVHQLVPMAREHAGDSLNWRHFVRAVRRYLLTNGIIMGLFRDRRLEATAAGVVGSDVFTGELTIYGLWWYVAPERRGSSDALAVLRALFREAGGRGVVKAEMGVQVVGNERVAEIYGRIGLAEHTTSFKGDLPCLQQ